MPLIPPNRVVAFPHKDDLYWWDPDVIFQPFDDIFGRGVVGSGDLQVVANATPDGQISVNPGRGYVPYQTVPGGKRLFRTNVAIRSDAAEFQHAIGAYTGTPRVDRIVAQVLDATLTPPDSLKGGVFDVLPGTPTTGATLANLSGAATVPATTLLLGNVLVNGSTIPGGNIDSTFPTVRAKAIIGKGNVPTSGKTIEVNGTPLTDRTNLNLIAGSNITISPVDNAGADSSDVTIAGTVPPPTVIQQYDYTTTTPAYGKIDTNVDGPMAALFPQTGFSKLVCNVWFRGVGTGTDDQLAFVVNNDTSNNYDWFYASDRLDGSTFTTPEWNGGSTQALFYTMRGPEGASAATCWGVSELTIYNYASTQARIVMYSQGVDWAYASGRRWRGMCVYHGASISRIWCAISGGFTIGSRMTVWLYA